MNLPIGTSDIINGLVLGIFSSIFASIIISSYIVYRENRKYRKMYSRWNGIFYGYAIEDEKERIVSTSPASEATMKYVGKNKIEFRLTDLNSTGRNIWSGVIFMDTENSGTMTWRYEKHLNEELGKTKHLFGIKKVFTSEVSGEWFMFLMEQPMSATSCHFGNEVFRKK